MECSVSSVRITAWCGKNVIFVPAHPAAIRVLKSGSQQLFNQSPAGMKLRKENLEDSPMA